MVPAADPCGPNALTVPETLRKWFAMIPIETGRDESVIQAILKDVSNGTSLNIACQKRKIAPSTFRDWIESDKALGERYARAKTRQLEFWGEEVLDIATGARRLADAAMLTELDPTKPVIFTDNKIAIMRDRLAADQARWTLAKLMPKQFGDRLAIDMANPEARPPETEEEIAAARQAWIEKRGNA